MELGMEKNYLLKFKFTRMRENENISSELSSSSLGEEVRGEGPDCFVPLGRQQITTYYIPRYDDR